MEIKNHQELTEQLGQQQAVDRATNWLRCLAVPYLISVCLLAYCLSGGSILLVLFIACVIIGAWALQTAVMHDGIAAAWEDGADHLHWCQQIHKRKCEEYERERKNPGPPGHGPSSHGDRGANIRSCEAAEFDTNTPGSPGTRPMLGEYGDVVPGFTGEPRSTTGLF